MRATIAPSGLYRYTLEREWNAIAPRIGFVMLNPSTADATSDDATIRRCINFAQSWGYGAIEVVNLFGYRATQPSQLRLTPDPIGSENDRYILDMSQQAPEIVVAWGNYGHYLQRCQTVSRLLSDHQGVYCLGMTQSGHPRHPLYLKRDAARIAFSHAPFSNN
ncbi:MAG: DUF1643 domain-containing protein [Chroococcidiopsidaceae cyanobacterium CP_BM_ER_R8_30]|nr:DUF1643 domain-containing protein [Chroococcidiopsidaceae cyanobacterium CP_BM_ER_R8_30]